jgi:hypothetical protein
VPKEDTEKRKGAQAVQGRVVGSSPRANIFHPPMLAVLGMDSADGRGSPGVPVVAC